MEETMFEESSGNVFADLGFENADEMLMRGKINRHDIILAMSANAVPMQ